MSLLKVEVATVSLKYSMRRNDKIPINKTMNSQKKEARKILDLPVFEELNDADLMPVVGGGATGDLVSGITGIAQNTGNTGTPTSGAVTLLGNTLIAAGTYLNKVGSGSEVGLQGANQTLTNVGNDL